MFICKISDAKDTRPTLYLKYHGLIQIMHVMNTIIKVGAISFVCLPAENSILAQIFSAILLNSPATWKIFIKAVPR